jgi:hypothetical protein
MIVEGGGRRRLAQEHVYVQCRLLERLTDFFADVNKATSTTAKYKKNREGSSSASIEQNGDSVAAETKVESTAESMVIESDGNQQQKQKCLALIAGCRNPLVGADRIVQRYELLVFE